jgi:2-dehydro-3-deoxygluconokinase
MAELVAGCDVVIGNEEDAEKIFGIRAPGSDVTAGVVSADKYRWVAEQLAGRFTNIRTVAITLRGSLSASHNTWSGLLWRDGKLFTGPSYDILPIVDRVGAGDAFAGGIIYGLRRWPDNPQRALDFAVAAGCLKHSIPGDLNLISLGEVEQLVSGDASGRVAR